MTAGSICNPKPMKSIIQKISIFTLLALTCTGLFSQGLSDLYRWDGFQYNQESGIMKMPKYAPLKVGDKLNTASGNTYTINQPGLIITNEEGFKNLYYEKLKLDSLSKATSQYIQLQNEVNQLQKEISAQKDTIIAIQDVAYEARKQLADSLGLLTERSMRNTERAVETIERAQRRTWLFTIGGVAVGATIGLIAGAFIK